MFMVQDPGFTLKSTVNGFVHVVHIAWPCLTDACEIDVLRHEIDASTKHHPLCANPSRPSQPLFVRASRPSQIVFVHASSITTFLCQFSRQSVTMFLFQFCRQFVTMFLCQFSRPSVAIFLCQFSRPSITMLLCQFSRPSITMLLCPVFGLTPGLPASEIFCTHHLVLATG